jgi:hypothetical protein
MDVGALFLGMTDKKSIETDLETHVTLEQYLKRNRATYTDWRMR